MALFFVANVAAEPATVPGEYIIKYRAEASLKDRAAVAKIVSARSVRPLPLIDAQVITLPPGQSLSSAQQKSLRSATAIEYIEPNFLYSIDTAPNDHEFASQWALHNDQNVDLDAPDAWDVTTGSEDVVVGIIDTGIEYTHPDLAANIWTNAGEIADDGVDNDGNGYVDDIHGINAILGSGDPLDDHSHGTHCAGVIGAIGNNGLGISGINWHVKMMALKFLDASGSGSTSGAITAINYAIEMKHRGVNIRILSNSWGGGGFSSALQDAISAAQAEGILFVAAAGNAGSNNDSLPTYPASYDLDSIIAVAAVDSAGNLAGFSNFGALSVDLAAPGVSILSTVTGGQYGAMSGTSMATPHVSGVAALVLAREALSLTQLRDRILQTAQLLPNLSGLLVVPGVVNANNALHNVTSPVPPTAPQLHYTKRSAPFLEQERGSRVLETDDGYSVQQLGFSFPYYGEHYSQIVISSNGRILLGGTAPVAPDYANRLSEGICPYHTDLTVSQTLGHGETGVYFRATADEAVITWLMVNYQYRGSSDENALLRVQVRLRSSGEIVFLYGDTVVGDPGFDYGAVATVGIAPPSGIVGAKLPISENESNDAVIGSGKALSLSLRHVAVSTDFDGDGIADPTVWRPSTGTWYSLLSSANFDFATHRAMQFGLPGDMPVPGDYDGDAHADYAVWRPSDGSWYLHLSSSDALSVIQWGLAGDKPLAEDYDGDGKTDLAVYRPSTGSVYGLLSSGGFDRDGALTGRSLTSMVMRSGGNGYDLLAGDFNGDGRADVASIWQLIRFWTVNDYTGAMLFSSPWGEPGDTPVTCDRDGDGSADRLVSRVMPNNLFEHYTATAAGSVYIDTLGSLGDETHCRDYDGDSKGDLTLFRPLTGEWFIRSSGSGELNSYQFGLPGDIAL